MGLFDFITGNRAPGPSQDRLSRDDLYARLLAARDLAGRWSVRPIENKGRAELVAEWTMIDEQTRGLLGASGRRRGIRVLMRLVPEEGIVRSVDEEGEFSWSAGLDHLSFDIQAFRGQRWESGKSWTFATKPDGGFGKTSEAQWGTDDIKGPLREIVAQAGWGWRGVAFTRL